MIKFNPSIAFSLKGNISETYFTAYLFLVRHFIELCQWNTILGYWSKWTFCLIRNFKQCVHNSDIRFWYKYTEQWHIDGNTSPDHLKDEATWNTIMIRNGIYYFIPVIFCFQLTHTHMDCAYIFSRVVLLFGTLVIETPFSSVFPGF